MVEAMRARRGRRSEPFWPSIVMKKWLNIKPKVYDFSEDEVDTETESEDDACSLGDARVNDDDDHNLTHGVQTHEPYQRWSRFSDSADKSVTRGHRRGKSETLRLQYIKTKDIRVTIGTWNVAGRLPNDDLNIDEWLCTEAPADIYIIGFQEVVPLNAGNVLGAEDRGPIPKWEAIIRRTLNKSLEETETKLKCPTAPPSPVLMTESVNDVLVEKLDDSQPLEMVHGDLPEAQSLCEATGIGRSLQLARACGFGYDGNLDWPEHPLGSNLQVVCTKAKLRRVSSSSARLGFDLFDNAVAYSPQHVAYNTSHLKRCHSSETLRQMSQDRVHEADASDALEALSDASDEPFAGEEEEDEEEHERDQDHDEDDMFFEMPAEQQGKGFDGGGANVKLRPKYVRIVSKQMVGIYISIWIRKRFRRHVNHLKVSPVGIGLMGYMGNKGSVSVSMTLFQSRLCFVCSHLTSGQKDGAEQRRNADVYEIIRRTRFTSVIDSDQPQTIPCHDQIFWFGDLNYRINLLDAEVRKLIASRSWDELLKHDQLNKELRSGHVFKGWREGDINFAPTYKYEFDSDTYNGENPKEDEKRRSPAWCDRILWLGKGIKQLCYKRSEIKMSDHRPVSSVFLVEAEVFDQRKLQRALNINNAAVHPEPNFFIEE